MSDDAPDRQLIILQDVAWRVGWVLRLQDELALFLGQALYQDIAVEAGNDYMARFCRDGAADDQMVAVEDSCTCHAVTAHGDHIGVRSLEIQQSIKRQLVLHVIKRGAGKASWNACIKERKDCAAALQRAEDKCGAHNGLLINCIYIQ